MESKDCYLPQVPRAGPDWHLMMRVLFLIMFMPQVLGGSYDFMVPKYKKVSVVWIDPYLSDQKKLRSIINRNDVQNGFPILLSNCLSSHEVEGLVKKLKLEDLGVKILSAEMFSHFDSELKKQPFFSLDLNQMLKEKNIIFYGPRKPNEITGDFQFKLIK